MDSFGRRGAEVDRVLGQLFLASSEFRRVKVIGQSSHFLLQIWNLFGEFSTRNDRSLDVSDQPVDETGPGVFSAPIALDGLSQLVDAEWDGIRWLTWTGLTRLHYRSFPRNEQRRDKQNCKNKLHFVKTFWTFLLWCWDAIFARMFSNKIWWYKQSKNWSGLC